MGVYFKRIEQSVVSDSKIFLFFGKGERRRGGGGVWLWGEIGISCVGGNWFGNPPQANNLLELKLFMSTST